MTMYNIISKINSTFGTIGKATTDKLTETVDGKNSTELSQGTKLTFFSRSHLAPKFSKVVAKSKKLVAI